MNSSGPQAGGEPRFHILQDGLESEPYSLDQIEAALKGGLVAGDQMARLEGESEWMPLHSLLKRLTAARTAAPALPPLPPAPKPLPPMPAPPPPAHQKSLPPLPPVPPAPPSPVNRLQLFWRRMVLGLILVGLYAYYPYHGVLKLKRGLASGRPEVLETYIDFESVRASLTNKIGREILVQVSSNASPSLSRRYQQPGFLHGIVGQTVTAAGLLEVRQGVLTNGSWQGRVPFPFFSAPTEFAVKVSDLEFEHGFAENRYSSSKVNLRVRAPEVRLLFKFAERRWRLTAVELPQPATCDVLIPPRLPKATGPPPGSKLKPTAQTPLGQKTVPDPETIPPGDGSTPDPVPPTPPPPDVPRPEPTWTGLWQVKYLHELVINQTGNRVEGFFITPTNYLIRGTVAGTTLVGEYLKCSEKATNMQARIELTLSGDGSQFSGAATYYDPYTRRMRNDPWNGRRISP